MYSCSTRCGAYTRCQQLYRTPHEWADGPLSRQQGLMDEGLDVEKLQIAIASSLLSTRVKVLHHRCREEIARAILPPKLLLCSSRHCTSQPADSGGWMKCSLHHPLQAALWSCGPSMSRSRVCAASMAYRLVCTIAHLLHCPATPHALPRGEAVAPPAVHPAARGSSYTSGLIQWLWMEFVHSHHSISPARN
jgi:hypothetical protein